MTVRPHVHPYPRLQGALDHSLPRFRNLPLTRLEVFVMSSKGSTNSCHQRAVYRFDTMDGPFTMEALYVILYPGTSCPPQASCQQKNTCTPRKRIGLTFLLLRSPAHQMRPTRSSQICCITQGRASEYDPRAPRWVLCNKDLRVSRRKWEGGNGYIA